MRVLLHASILQAILSSCCTAESNYCISNRKLLCASTKYNFPHLKIEKNLMFPHTRHPEDGEAAAQEKERLHLIHCHYSNMFTKKRIRRDARFKKQPSKETASKNELRTSNQTKNADHKRADRRAEVCRSTPAWRVMQSIYIYRLSGEAKAEQAQLPTLPTTTHKLKSGGQESKAKRGNKTEQNIPVTVYYPD